MRKDLKKVMTILKASKPITFLIGPEFATSQNLIEIDVTYACNLKCLNCNRSCSQAPDDCHMDITQIDKFIDETLKSSRTWERIRILGGEPFLHPEIKNILEKFVEFKKDFSHSTRIEISTNGYSTMIAEQIKNVPPEVAVINTYKESIYQEKFELFNLAPCDLRHHYFTDYSNACWVTNDCGIGLNKFGYYHCAVAAGIDRVMGFNVGLKSLPPLEEQMLKQKQMLCRFCGHFLNRIHIKSHLREKISEEVISNSWKSSYKRYSKIRPALSIY